MKKLIIDHGNTACKYYFFQGKAETGMYYGEGPDQSEHLHFVLSGFGPFDRAIFCSVSNPGAFPIEELNNRMPTLYFNSTVPVPIENAYKTPATLGTDRLAAAVGANSLFPGETLLVIDAGSCITFDLIHNQVFMGGLITPGIIMQAKAMHTFTGKLPLIHPVSTDHPSLTGTDTYDAMLSGIINGTISAMEGIIGRYLNLFHGLKIILTGGNLNFFDKQLKYSIFALPNLVGAGLNEILDFNEDNL
jgi:type III pantothenate kinase